MGRRPFYTKQEHLKRGAWTAEEDRILTNYIHTHAETGWRSLPKRAGLNRCGKSCRLRWLNYLRPDIKRGNISADEDELIIRLHRLLGNRWALIAGRLPGRTDNEIKNYWNTHLSKMVAMSSMRSAIDSAADVTLSTAENQFSEDDGSIPSELKCGSDNEEEEEASDEIKLLQESFMANPGEDITQVDDNNISSSKLNVSYHLDHCNLFSSSCNEFSVDNLIQGDNVEEDLYPLQNNPHGPFDNVDTAKCLGIAGLYNSLEGDQETRKIELPPLEKLFEWDDHLDFTTPTTTYKEEYLDYHVDFPYLNLT